MNTIKSFTSIAIALSFASTASAASIALIDNSFEAGFSGSSNSVGSGWFSFAGTSSANSGLALDGTGFFNAMTPLDGTAGAFVVSTSDSDGASAYQAVTLSAGQTYKFTVALGTNDLFPKSDAKFGVVIYDSNFSTNVAGTFGELTAGGGTFSDYSVEYTAASTATYHIGVRSLGHVPGTGADNNESAVFIDNASLDSVPEPSSTALLGLGGLALILRRRK